MARKSGELMLVKAALLPTYPLAFQEYVGRYFERRIILGVDCFYAFRDLNGHSVHAGFKCAGIAPSQHGYLRKEVSDGVDLSSWLERICSDKQQDGIVCLRNAWNDGCIESDAD